MAKVIVITGGGDGLGRALAHRFAGDGDRVIILGRRIERLHAVADEIGGGVIALACDVADPSSIRSTFAEIDRQAGTIDVLINCAATYDVFPIEDARDEQITEAINTNLTGTIFCVRAAISLMQRGAHIINVSSDGVELPFPLMSVYQASKAGVERFTTALHRELEPRGIRVSVIRAAAMAGGGKGWSLDPELGARFYREAAAAGIDLRNRPTSNYSSATHMFRTLIDLPDDIHALSAVLCPRKS
jgi:meso-butanediol dehydrogenase / (S,S)-butanediol dehydrogenase / diacetyl reductase